MVKPRTPKSLLLSRQKRKTKTASAPAPEIQPTHNQGVVNEVRVEYFIRFNDDFAKICQHVNDKYPEVEQKMEVKHVEAVLSDEQDAYINITKGIYSPKSVLACNSTTEQIGRMVDRAIQEHGHHKLNYAEMLKACAVLQIQLYDAHGIGWDFYDLMVRSGASSNQALKATRRVCNKSLTGAYVHDMLKHVPDASNEYIQERVLAYLGDAISGRVVRQCIEDTAKEEVPVYVSQEMIDFVAGFCGIGKYATWSKPLGLVPGAEWFSVSPQKERGNAKFLELLECPSTPSTNLRENLQKIAVLLEARKAYQLEGQFSDRAAQEEENGININSLPGGCEFTIVQQKQ